jgi:hypothetical protein
VRILPKISSSVCAGGVDDEPLGIQNAEAAFAIAPGIEVGVDVGWTAWNGFCTTAGTCVPVIVPFASVSK